MADPLTLDELRERATITVAEAAALLGVKADTLYEHGDALPFMRRLTPRRWLVAAPALVTWLCGDEAADEPAEREDGHEPPLRVIDGAGGQS